MSREFIDAIESGDNLEAGDEFNNSISSKVGDALEFRRKELSQNFAGNNGLVEESDPDDIWCVYDAEDNIISEHESEYEAKAAIDEDGGLLGWLWRKKTGIKNPLNLQQRAKDAVTDKVMGLFSKKADTRKSPGAMGGKIKK